MLQKEEKRRSMAEIKSSYFTLLGNKRVLSSVERKRERKKQVLYMTIPSAKIQKAVNLQTDYRENSFALLGGLIDTRQSIIAIGLEAISIPN